MKPQEVSIKPNLIIVLESDSEMIDEVVVTGMQKMDKRLFTGASDKLSGEATKLDGIPDISRALEGRSARCFRTECFRNIWYCSQNPCTWSNLYLW